MPITLICTIVIGTDVARRMPIRGDRKRGDAYFAIARFAPRLPSGLVRSHEAFGPDAVGRLAAGLGPQLSKVRIVVVRKDCLLTSMPRGFR